jgi:hypothetical protein
MQDRYTHLHDLHGVMQTLHFSGTLLGATLVATRHAH